MISQIIVSLTTAALIANKYLDQCPGSQQEALEEAKE